MSQHYRQLLPSDISEKLPQILTDKFLLVLKITKNWRIGGVALNF